MKRRILALLLAGALLTGLSSAAEPGRPGENREEAVEAAVLPDASGEAPEETAEQPEAPAEQDPTPETEEETSPETEGETTPETEEETAGTQAAATRWSR